MANGVEALREDAIDGLSRARLERRRLIVGVPNGADLRRVVSGVSHRAPVVCQRPRLLRERHAVSEPEYEHWHCDHAAGDPAGAPWDI